MKATTLLLSQHRNIQELAQSAARASTRDRDARTCELVEAVVAYFAMEEIVLYPEVERQLGLDLRAQRATLTRARLALFRVVTAPLREDSFRGHVESLDRALREHALGESCIVRALERDVSEPALYRLADKMRVFQKDLLARPAFAWQRTALAS